MKKFSKKGVLLFVAAMALCALAMPPMASGLSWDPLGTNQTLTSPDIGFTSTVPGVGTLVSSCTDSTFNVQVAAAASSTLEVTGASFGPSCTMIVAGAAVCNVDATGTKFPWTITALATSNVRLDNVHIDWTFTQTAGVTCPAALAGQRLTITGNVTSGISWNPATDELILSNAEGIVAHGPTGTAQYTWRGTITDNSGTRLDLTD